MTNALGNYNPLFYAQEALILLEQQLGMAARVHRGYEQERRAFEKGDKITIRKPGDFVVQDAPSTAQDLNPEKVDITLDQWKEVKYAITDKEASYTQEDIMREHVRPAVYRIAQYIDAQLNLLAIQIPWKYDLTANVPGTSIPGGSVNDMTGPQRVMFDNNVPMDGVHYEINGLLQQGLLSNSAFTQWQGAGATGVASQLSGSLGNRFGFEVFANQNVQSYTAGFAADAAGATTADVATAATSIPINGMTAAATFKKGDIVQVAGMTQQFVLTADVTMSSGAGTLLVFPAVPGVKGATNTIASGAVVTILVGTAAATKVLNLAFHRNFAALVMVPISTMGQGLGARMFTATDPKTGISIRARLFYDGNTSKVYWAFDVLFGMAVLDPNLAVRCQY